MVKRFQVIELIDRAVSFSIRIPQSNNSAFPIPFSDFRIPTSDFKIL